ncbi:MAG: hypothetical protein KF802_00095 [Bdellovibrionaceae bacterium]|nr:hypothetical protein [Pseudobdellovibrionaceae bacterium]MBX3034770.1 hypothetical protein [Pseudobdellovibrionaceae bacterium]
MQITLIVSLLLLGGVAYFLGRELLFPKPVPAGRRRKTAGRAAKAAPKNPDVPGFAHVLFELESSMGKKAVAAGIFKDRELDLTLRVWRDPKRGWFLTRKAGRSLLKERTYLPMKKLPLTRSLMGHLEKSHPGLKKRAGRIVIARSGVYTANERGQLQRLS